MKNKIFQQNLETLGLLRKYISDYKKNKKTENFYFDLYK